MPDIVIGHLLSLGDIAKVIFGANGIDLDYGRKGFTAIGHTAGHLTILELAKKYEVPVYVVSDGYKFGTIESHLKDRENQRWGTQWVAGGGKVLTDLNEITLYNPREDIILANETYALVIELGVFPPQKIPKNIACGIVASK